MGVQDASKKRTTELCSTLPRSGLASNSTNGLPQFVANLAMVLVPFDDLVVAFEGHCFDISALSLWTILLLVSTHADVANRWLRFLHSASVDENG